MSSSQEIQALVVKNDTQRREIAGLLIESVRELDIDGNYHNVDNEALFFSIKSMKTALGDNLGAIIAYRNKKPIGCISAYIMPPMAGMTYFVISFVSFFFVIPKERDGLAALALLEALKPWSKERKATEIHLPVTSGINTKKTHNMLEENEFHVYGMNYTANMPMEIDSAISRMAEAAEGVIVDRLSSDKDISIIKEIAEASVKEGIHKNRQFDANAFITQTKQALKHNRHSIIFVAEYENEPVSYATANLNLAIGQLNFTSCHISNFYIAPKQYSAIGAKMIIEILAWAREKKANEVIMFIFGSHSMDAIGELLYKAGFKMAGGNYVLSLKSHNNQSK